MISTFWQLEEKDIEKLEKQRHKTDEETRDESDAIQFRNISSILHMKASGMEHLKKHIIPFSEHNSFNLSVSAEQHFWLKMTQFQRSL